MILVKRGRKHFADRHNGRVTQVGYEMILVKRKGTETAIAYY